MTYARNFEHIPPFIDPDRGVTLFSKRATNSGGMPGMMADRWDNFNSKYLTVDNRRNRD